MTRLLASLLSCLVLAACAAGSSASAPAEGSPGLTAHSLRVNGAERSYFLHVPAGLTLPAPVVLSLHGGGGNGEIAARMTGFSDEADAGGFIAVYPEGSSRRLDLNTWNAGHCCAYAMEQGVNDVAFIGALIDRLVAEGLADPDRVFVSGMSNGAMMTHRLGRELSGKIAGIAPVVGAVFGDEPLPASPVSAIIITGDKDTSVPGDGGFGDIGRRRKPADAPYAPARAQFDYWAKANGCTGPVRREETAVYTLLAHDACREGTRVHWYALRENGHAWPGGEKARRRAARPIADFDATAVIWDFFAAQ